MPGFHEVRFPPQLSYGASGGPMFKTDIIEMQSGIEKRNINWSKARLKWDVSHTVKTQDDVDELIAFFRGRQGRAYGFRFRDWSDYTLTDQQIGVGDGVEDQFQVVKTYNSGDGEEIRTISKIVSNADALAIAIEQCNGVYTPWQVYIDSVLQVEGVDYDMDRDSGIIIFDSTPADNSIITVNGEFDVAARFDTDKMAVKIEYFNDYSWGEIPIIEIKQ